MRLSCFGCEKKRRRKFQSFQKQEPQLELGKIIAKNPGGGGGGGTLGISGWGCADGTLEPLTCTRASSAEFCYPILE